MISINQELSRFKKDKLKDIIHKVNADQKEYEKKVDKEKLQGVKNE